MSSERQSSRGSFRTEIEELLVRLNHENVINAGSPHQTAVGPDGRKLRKRKASPFMLNQALYERAQQSGRS